MPIWKPNAGGGGRVIPVVWISNGGTIGSSHMVRVIWEGWSMNSYVWSPYAGWGREEWLDDKLLRAPAQKSNMSITAQYSNILNIAFNIAVLNIAQHSNVLNDTVWCIAVSNAARYNDLSLKYSTMRKYIAVSNVAQYSDVLILHTTRYIDVLS